MDRECNNVAGEKKFRDLGIPCEIQVKCGTTFVLVETSKQADRWLFLDAIRGFAALAVVLQHVLWYASPSFENVFATIWSPGRFGVVAFFIVSGFIVPRSLEVKKDLKAFWTSRFFRLFPTYWASLAIIAIVQAVGLVWHPPLTGKVALQWVVNLTMLQQFVRIPDVNPVAWTLGLELVFYGAITIAFMQGFLRRSWAISLTLLGLLFAASTILPGVFHVRFPAGAAAVCGSIVAGLALFRYFNGEIKKLDAFIITTLCLFVTVVSSFVNYSTTRLESDILQPTQLSAISSVATGYLFFLAMLKWKNARFPNWVLWLGKVSYSLYLLHPIAGMIVPDTLAPGLRVVPELILSLVFAWLGYRYLEVPSMNLAKRAFAKQKRVVASQQTS